MGDKTPTKAQDTYVFTRHVHSPVTRRNAVKREWLPRSPRIELALDYDHASTLSSKKPKIVEEDLKHVTIDSLKHGKNPNAKMILNVLSYMKYSSNVVSVLACDDSGIVVISGYWEAAESLLHVAKEEYSCIELTDFETWRPTYKNPTASYNGLEIDITSKKSVRTLGPAADFNPRFIFSQIGDVLRHPNGMVVDILGVIVKSWENVDESGRPAFEVSLFDKTEKTISLSIWHDDSLFFRRNLLGKVIIVRRAVTSPYGGRCSIESFWFTQYELEPPNKHAQGLLSWYQDYVKQRQQFKEEPEDKEEDAKEFLN